MSNNPILINQECFWCTVNAPVNAGAAIGVKGICHVGVPQLHQLLLFLGAIVLVVQALDIDLATLCLQQ